MHALNKPLRASGLLLAVLMLAAAPLALAGDDESGGYLGVYLQDVNSSLAKALQMGDEPGVLIQGVIEDSPAEKAGLEDGDVILAFAGIPADDQATLTKSVRKAKPGQKVEIVVLREGKKKTIEVELGEIEENPWHMNLDSLKDLKFDLKDKFKTWSVDDDDDVYILGGRAACLDLDRGYLGIQMQDLGEQLGEYFGVKDGKGVLVSNVEENGAAAKAGLKAGDVIVKLSDKTIAEPRDLHKALAGTEPDDEVKVEVLRQGKTKEFTVTLGGVPEKEFCKQIQIMSGDDDEGEIRAPRMIMRHGAPECDLNTRHREYRRIYSDEREDMDQLRDELNELRAELKELRKELRK